MPPELFSSGSKCRLGKFLVLIVLVIGFLSSVAITPLGAGQSEEDHNYEWYNSTWRHRFRIEITPQVETKNWPIERGVNFTELLRKENNTGTFDENSLRVFHYNETGEIIKEVPSQFDKSENYTQDGNAYGTLIFNLNGTYNKSDTQYFYVYYDSQDNGPKEAVNYETGLSFTRFDNEQKINVSTKYFNYSIDTDRKDNTSGIYNIYWKGTNEDHIILAGKNERTAEYAEYTNGTHDFTFNLSKNMTVKEQGPLKLVLEQKGHPVFYEGNEKENLLLTKRYHFYWKPDEETDYNENDNTQYPPTHYKIEQQITNIGNTSYTLKSTPSGAVRWDLNRTLYDTDSIQYDEDYANYTDPYSWVLGRKKARQNGLINLNGSAEEFGASVVTKNGNISKIGINLSEVTLGENETLRHLSLHSGSISPSFLPGAFFDVRDTVMNPPEVYTHETESHFAKLDTWTNETVYNRGEVVQVVANITSDPYNLTDSLTTVLNKNTTSSQDNITLQLQENNPGYWNETYILKEGDNTGLWNSTSTTYSVDDVKLGENTSSFKVTDKLNGTIVLKEETVPAGEVIEGNLTVTNFKEERSITEANLSCVYDGTEVKSENITELGAGVYSFNFTSPSEIGNYNLSCEANKTGNRGNYLKGFNTEVAKVTPNTSFSPDFFEIENVNYTNGKNLTFKVNVSNNENGTAYNANISLDKQDNWTLNSSFQQCGNIEPDDYCQSSFELSIPKKTNPGNYSVNLTANWTNPDETKDNHSENLSVEILKNPITKVEEEEIRSRAAGGMTTRVDNFTVQSLGNYRTENISYECTDGYVCNNFDLSFTPENISLLETGNNETVETYVAVPKGSEAGNYSGKINASSEGSYDTFSIEIEVIGETDVAMETDPSDSITAGEVTLTDNQSLVFDINSTNTGEAFAFNVNQTTFTDGGWYTSPKQTCGDLNITESCRSSFEVTVPKNTTPGTYDLNTNTQWLNPDQTIGNSGHILTVDVLENPDQEVTSKELDGEVKPGYTNNIGNITVNSTGNYKLENVTYECESGEVCENFTVSFSPNETAVLGINETSKTDLNVTVPEGQRAGSYNGTVNISSTAGHDLVNFTVIVPTTRSWDLDKQDCIGSSDPNVGTLCKPTVTNTGNVKINITANPEEVNRTYIEPSNLTIDIKDSSQFNVSYNVTGASDKTHRATYNISTEKEADFKTSRLLNITLYPANPPEIKVNITPEEIVQTETVEIVSNVTRQTEFPIEQVNATVKKPDNTTIEGQMKNITGEVENSGNSTIWNISFPDNFEEAQTDLRGTYRVNVTAVDTIGNINTETSNFTTTANVSAKLMSLREKEDNTIYYTQGVDDQASVYYRLADANDQGIEGADVNISVTDPEGYELFSGSGKTDKNGTINPYDFSFGLPSDARIGMYNITAHTSWHEEEVNRTVEFISTGNFVVKGNFEINWDLGSIWTNGTNMSVWTSIRRNNAQRDVEDMNLTIYDPYGNVTGRSNYNDFTRHDKGIYTTREEIPDNAPFGVYWGKLEIREGGSRGVRYDSFRVTEEGVVSLANFDVNMSLDKHEIRQGNDLHFNLSIKKMEGEDTDAKISYWITDGETDYYYLSESIFTPVNETITLPRSAYIYSDQPTGNYTLEAEVDPLDGTRTFGASDSLKVLGANDTDEPETIIEEEVEEKILPADEPAPEETITNISIIDSPTTINLVAGGSTYESVLIANTGDDDLNNVSMSILGVPPTWHSISPPTIPSLPTETTRTFSVNMEVPEDAELGKHNTTFLVTSDMADTSKKLTVEVFESLEEKLKADIENLNDKIDELEARTKELEEKGVDVSAARAIINESKSKIGSANEKLDEGMFDEAMQDITEAESIAEEGERKLEQYKLPERREISRILPITIAGVAVLGLSLSILYAVKTRSARPLGAVKDKVNGVVTEMKKRKQKEEEGLLEEKRKAKRLLELIDSEHKEGIMDDETYENLKSSAEEKIERINKELGD